MANKQIGTLACYSCGERVPVKENEHGGLSFPCQWCDFPAYAKAGTQAVTIARGRMKPLDAGDKKEGPEKEEKQQKTIFG